MVTDETGKPICMMASFLDVTEQKRLREALRSSEERFRAIFEGALDCIYIKDESLRYTHVNPAMEKLVGLTAPEIIGRSAEEIFGEKETKRLVEVHLRALKGESVEEEHTRSVKGEDLTFHEITVPLRSAQGLIVGTCTISRNITELRRTQPVPRIKVRNYPSEAMSATLEQAHYAAARDSIVLLTGESGSGKDYVAQWIHSHSRRASGPFFAINCAALPQELAESELFGYEPGAFTGARARKRGMLELAEGGTLLLNEIGELPLALQSKLLTFLDTRSFMRVGGEKNIHINARIVAATHRDLEDEVASGRFLPALFYRLNVFCVNVPPLRERTDDIPILVEEILSILAAEMQLTEIPLIGSASMRVLMKYHWPGNVRELRNVLERALMLWDRGPFKLAIPGLDKTPEDWMCKVTFPLDRSLHEVTEEIRATLCSEALRRAQGNKKEAARILGISRYSFYRYVKSSGIECEYLT
jgi:PAS domain S-box-containing protein